MVARFDLIGRTVIVALGRSVARSANLLLAVILVRVVSPTEWSTFALLLSIYTAAVNIGGMNLHEGIYYFYGRLPASERRRLAIQTAGLLTVMGAITGGVIWSLDFVIDSPSFQVQGVLGILALAVFLELPSVGTPELLLSAEKPRLTSAFNAVFPVIQGAALVVPFLLGHGIETALWCLVGHGVLRLMAWAAVFVLALPPGELGLDRRLVRDQIVYTLPLGLAIGTSALNRQLDKWFVAWLDAPNFGAYSLASYEVPFIPILPYAMGAVMATRVVHAFASGDVLRAQQYWLSSSGRVMLVVIPATVGVLLCAEPLIQLLFTSEYALATVPFQIYSVILLHRVAQYGLMLRAAGDTRALWWASCTLLGANFAFSLPLTWRFGMVGAAIGTVIANAAAWLFVLDRIGHALDVGLSEVLDWGLYVRILGMSVISAAVVLWLLTPHTSSLPSAGDLLVRAACFTSIYLLCAWLSGVSKGLPDVPDDTEEFSRDLATPPPRGG